MAIQKPGENRISPGKPDPMRKPRAVLRAKGGSHPQVAKTIQQMMQRGK